MPTAPSPLAIVLMGVAGSGKTTVGRLLAAQLGWPFRDADEFHLPANVAKMSAGQPLDDQDRAPWLAAIRAYLAEQLSAGHSVVVTCSALKQRYRDALVPDPARTRLVHLQGDFGLILDRMRRRTDHFMKPAMLESQFTALEPPEGVERVDINRSPEEIVADIRRRLGLGSRSP